LKNEDLKDTFRGNSTVFLLAAVLVLGTVILKLLLPDFNVIPNRLSYLHFHSVDLKIPDSGGRLKGKNIYAEVFRNGRKITGIGNQQKINFVYDEKTGFWEGKFPVPWAAERGAYTVKVTAAGKKRKWDEIFYIDTRTPSVKVEKPLKILNLESAKRLTRFNVRTPKLEHTGYKGIYEWIKFMGADTLWYMAGQTAAYKEGALNIDFPWIESNVKAIPDFAKETNDNSIKFGGWVSCFRVFGNSKFKPDWYRYSYKYKGSRTAESDGISILDNRRVDDIKKLVKQLNETDSVNFVGLDYIRPAGGGLELVDEFIRAMRSIPVIDKWNWWRASRMSKIISYIKKGIEFKKPLWTFVLSWELGHQHGQDPIMFQDAGADLIAIMMYETDAPRFEHIVDEWQEYIKGFNINVIPGNQIDWPLHQHSVYPAGPEEFGRRLRTSVEKLKETGNVKGAFVHDFARAMWGRKGPYSTMEWMLAGAEGYSALDDDPVIRISLKTPRQVRDGRQYEGLLEVKNNSSGAVNGINIEFPDVPGIRVISGGTKIQTLKQNETLEIPLKFRIYGSPEYRLGRYMTAARVMHGENVYIDYNYSWVKGIPPDNWRSYR